MQTEAPIELIIAYCEGSISDTERGKLKAWREAYVDHEQFFRHFTSIWTTVQPSRSNFQPDVEKALGAVHQRLGRRLFIRRVSQVAALFILLLGIWQLLNVFQPKAEYQNWIADKQTVLYLPDSTKVILAKGTLLEYPVRFDSDQRAVTLEGKAYFDVRRNEEKPFVINTRNVRTTVLGTQFTLISTREGLEEVYLDEGSVAYSKKGWFSTETVLKPGEKAALVDGKVSKSSQENGNASAWATRKLRFIDTPLHQLIKEMEMFYGVSIQLQTDRIRNLRFTGTLSHETAEEALRVVALTLKLQLTNKNQTLTLSL